MKKEYNIKDTVWIHIGEKKLTEGRVVEIIDLEHLGEGHSKDNELYIIELKTGIEDVYEVRSAGLISPDAAGPLSVFRDPEKKADAVMGNRFMRKIGAEIPATRNPLVEIAEDIAEDLEPTPEQIHAAMERAQQSTVFPPLADSTPKRNNKPRRKPYNQRKKSAPNT